MLGLSRERQARDVSVQALGAEDARADGGGGAERRTAAASSSRSTTPPACTGTCAWSTTASSSPSRSPTGCPRRPRTTASRCTPRTIRSSTSSSRATSPRASTARGRMRVWDRGTYEVLKWEPRKIEVAPARRARAGALRALPDRQGREPEELDDPPHGPARRRGGGEPMPEKIVPMMARTGTLPRDDEHWAFEVKWDGVRAVCHSEPGPHAPALAQPARHHPALSRGRPPQPRARATTARCSTARSSPSTPRAGRASARCSGACTSARSPPCGGWPRRRRSPTSSSTCCGSTAHSLMDLPYSERRARLAELELGDGGRWRVPDYVVGHGAQLLGGHRAAGPRGRHRQAPGLDLRAGPAHAVVAEDQEHVAARRSSSAAGCPATASAATASARCSSGVRDDDGDAAPRRARRHRLHGGRARSPGRDAAPPRARGLALRAGRPEDPARRRVRRSGAGGRGRVPRVDRRRPAARALLQGPARRQAGGARRARGGQRRSWPRSAGARSSSRTSTRSSIPRPASPSATSSTTSRASRRPSCRTSRAAR